MERVFHYHEGVPVRATASSFVVWRYWDLPLGEGGAGGRARWSEVELPPTSIGEHVVPLTDPRLDRCEVHPLVEIVTIAPCGVILGADDGVATEAFGQEKEVRLTTATWT